MGLFDFFPYTSGHTLNLDWIIKTVKKLGGDFQIFKDEVNAKVATIPAEVGAEVAEAVSGITAADIDALPGIESAEYPGCYYRINGGVVEWFNPPLLAGIEYRTTERHLNKVVYKMVVDMGELPASENKYVYPPIQYNATVLSMNGVASDGKYRYQFPLISPSGVRGYLAAAYDGSNQFYIYARAVQDCSGLSAKVLITYTKE